MTLKEKFLKVLSGEKVEKIPVLSVTQTGIVELMDLTGSPWPDGAYRRAENVRSGCCRI